MNRIDYAKTAVLKPVNVDSSTSADHCLMDTNSEGAEGGIASPIQGRRRTLYCCLAKLTYAARIDTTRALTLPSKIADTKKPQSLNQGLFVINSDGGEGGIRTLDTLRYTHFPGVLLRPLGHLTELRFKHCRQRLKRGAYFNVVILLNQAISYVFSALLNIRIIRKNHPILLPKKRTIKSRPILIGRPMQ